MFEFTVNFARNPYLINWGLCFAICDLIVATFMQIAFDGILKMRIKTHGGERNA